MSIKRRFFWSALTLAAFSFLYGAYTHFATQAQADTSLEQLNGDNTAYGLARVASHDYSGAIISICAIFLFAIWAGALKQLICRYAAER
jgi:hypothetical protein